MWGAALHRNYTVLLSENIRLFSGSYVTNLCVTQNYDLGAYGLGTMALLILVGLESQGLLITGLGGCLWKFGE